MSPSMGLLPLLSSLGRALADFGHYHVGLVDPVLAWPCWDDGADAAEVGTRQFRGRWLGGPQLAAIAPRQRPQAGSLSDAVAGLVEYARPRCEYVLVDTSGLMPSAEDLTALAHLDAAFVVAATHQTTERALLARHGGLPDHQRLGVVLVSG